MRFLEKQRRSARKRVRDLYNLVVARAKTDRPRPETGFKELDEIFGRAMQRTDIADHLVTLFVESLVANPRLIVELGVGPGQSTFVFERVARLTGATHLSVDTEDRSHASADPQWTFVRADDIEFAREFPAWCRARNLPPKIDLLCIDTSHYYEHTLREIESYFPFLASRAKVFFHDTNLKSFYLRKSGRMELGWDNQRGVIRAIERYFGKSFNEREAFVDCAGGFLIRHYPYSCGLTMLDRVPVAQG